MDVAGLGVDIIEIDRMRVILERTPSFKTRVFSQAECEYCDAKMRPEVHYALRFAAKEAVLKALGVGFLGMRAADIEVSNDRFGKPVALLHGSAEELAKKQGVVEIPLSLSFTHTVGVANAVAVTEAVRPRIEEKVDPRAELAAAFKEAKSLLDELEGTSFAEIASEQSPEDEDEAPVVEPNGGEAEESADEEVAEPVSAEAEPGDSEEAGE